MKKIKLFIAMFFICFAMMLTGCEKEVIFTCSQSYIYMVAGETYELNYQIENADAPTFTYSYSEEGILEVKDNVVYGLTGGICDVTCTLEYKGQTKQVVFTVEVEAPGVEAIEALDEIEIFLGSTYQLEWKVLPQAACQDVEFKSFNTYMIDVTETGLITTKNLGKTKINIVSAEDSGTKKQVQVTIVRPPVESITGDSLIELNVGETRAINYSLNSEYVLQDVTFEVENDRRISVDNEGNVTGICAGETTVKIISKENVNIYHEVKIKVNGTLTESLEVEENVSVNIGELYLLEYKILPSDAHQKLDFIVNDPEAIEIDENGVLCGCKVGTYQVTVKTLDGTDFEKTIEVTITGNNTPTFILYDCNQDEVVNWGKDFDPLKGVKVFDGEDGNLTSSMVVDGEVDNKSYGTYTLTYTATDSDGNTAQLVRTIEVVWNYSVTFIGHRGSYYGVDNTEEAILYGITVLKYQAIEIDLKQTKDGVFVLCHDPVFGSYNLETVTYDEIKDKTTTITRDGVKYTSTICTLERFLEICKEYNVKAVIELKTSSGISNWTELNKPESSRMPALFELIEKVGVVDQVILLSSQQECLKWTRKNGYDHVECQYLVGSCENEQYLKTCIDYNFTISMQVTDNVSNSDEWLQRYKDAGIKLACYTFSKGVSEALLQSCIDKGYSYITTDLHDMADFDLPEIE